MLSDILYYRALVVAVIGPIVLYFFINAMTEDDTSNAARLILYSVIGVIMIRQWYVLLNTRKVLLDSKSIIIKRYFSNKEKLVPISSILDVQAVFNAVKKREGLLYVLKYDDNGVKQKIYFYKPFDLHNIGDLRKYFGL